MNKYDGGKTVNNSYVDTDSCMQPVKLKMNSLYGRKLSVPKENEYNVTWKLIDDNGDEVVQTFEEITLSDFEIIYGNNTCTLISCDIVMTNRVID